MKLLASILFSISVVCAFAQKSTYFGIEIGPKYEVFQHSGNGSVIYTKPNLSSPIFGVSICQELNESFNIETGVIGLEYYESYRRQSDYPYYASSAIISLQIPIRLKAKLNLVKNKFFLVTTVGYSLCNNRDFGSSGRSSFGNPSSSIYSYDFSDYSLRRTFSLIEGGIGLMYQFKKGLIIDLNSQYFYGFNRVINIDVYYSVDQSPVEYTNVFSNGDYFSFTLGLKYPISNLWNKKSNSP